MNNRNFLAAMQIWMMAVSRVSSGTSSEDLDVRSKYEAFDTRMVHFTVTGRSSEVFVQIILPVSSHFIQKWLGKERACLGVCSAIIHVSLMTQLVS